PTEVGQQTLAPSDQVPIERDALAANAHSSRRRLLPNTPMGEPGDYSTVPDQQEDAFASSDDPFLEHDRIDFTGEGVETALEIDEIFGVGDRRLGAARGA